MEFQKALQTPAGNSSLETQWNHVAFSYKTVSENTIQRDQVSKKCYISNDTWKLIKLRKETKVKLNTANADEDQIILFDYHNLDRQINKTARKDRR